MPETTVHLVLRTFLYQLLRFAFGDSCCVGSGQFVYWRAADPKTCLAPDLFLKLGVPAAHFDFWKTWERGTPELAVEIVSQSDREAWDEKLAKYQDLGVRELLRFDAEAQVGARLRAWDRVDDDLVERALSGDAAESFVVGRFWVVAEVDGVRGLRLAEDAGGRVLVPSPVEAATRETEAANREKEAANHEKKEETRQRQQAEQRVRELEAELKRHNKLG